MGARGRNTDMRPEDKPRPLGPWRAWYGTARWLRLRAAQLRDAPLCRLCMDAGRVTPATVCDHVEPHRGDPVRFWGGPFQSLCASCHSGTKQAEEQSSLQRRGMWD